MFIYTNKSFFSFRPDFAVRVHVIGSQTVVVPFQLHRACLNALPSVAGVKVVTECKASKNLSSKSFA